MPCAVWYILKGNTLEIFPPEAEVVHFIFCSYLAGMSLEELVHELNRRNHRSGGSPKDGTSIMCDIFLQTKSM